MKRICVFILLLCGFSGSAFPDGKWILYKTGFESEFISSLAMEGDAIWAGTSDGAVLWNRKNGTFQRFTTQDGLLLDSISAIAIDRNGVKWFGHSYSQGKVGVTSFDNSVWKKYTQQTVPQFAEYDSLHNNHWRVNIDDIVVDPEGTILFSADGTYSRADAGGVQGISNLFIYQNKVMSLYH